MKKLFATSTLALLLITGMASASSATIRPENQLHRIQVPSGYLQDRLISDTKYLIDTAANKTGTAAKLISNVGAGQTPKTDKFDQTNTFKSMLKIYPSWKNQKTDWCAWTVSFMLRGEKIHDKNKSAVILSSSYFLNSIMREGGTQITEASNTVKYLKGQGNIPYKAQAGDLIVYFGNRTIGEGATKSQREALTTKVKKFLVARNFTDDEKKKNFVHIALVISSNAVIEGNRGGLLRLTSHLPVDTNNEGYVGFVIIRPNWK